MDSVTHPSPPPSLPFGPTQVILKPDPGNPQELYLGSLEALGIDTRAHDVRFVEDNWESPVLGAWGLGWEVSERGHTPALLPPALLASALLARGATQEPNNRL